MYALQRAPCFWKLDLWHTCVAFWLEHEYSDRLCVCICVRMSALMKRGMGLEPSTPNSCKRRADILRRWLSRCSHGMFWSLPPCHTYLAIFERARIRPERWWPPLRNYPSNIGFCAIFRTTS